MKKLLSILGTIGVMGTAGGAVVAYTTNNAKIENNTIDEEVVVETDKDELSINVGSVGVFTIKNYKEIVNPTVKRSHAKNVKTIVNGNGEVWVYGEQPDRIYIEINGDNVNAVKRVFVTVHKTTPNSL